MEEPLYFVSYLFERVPILFSSQGLSVVGIQTGSTCFTIQYIPILYIWGWVKTYYSHIWGNNHPWKPAMTHRVPRVPCFDPQQRLAQTGPDLLVPVENCLPRMESKQTKGRTLFAHDSFPDNVGLKLEKGESFDRVSLLRNPVQEYRSIPRPWFPRIWRTQTHAHFC